jgi:hypothetical protein
MKNLKNYYPWSDTESKKIQKLDSPEKIQQFLDTCRYNLAGIPSIPSTVFKKKCAHCFDGAVFAASVFAYHGEPPLILDMCAERDDDHVLAIYRVGRYFGAVAKSNYTGLRFREPIFLSARELVKSLREYSEPFDLRRIKLINWSNQNKVFDIIANAIINTPHKKIVPTTRIKRLAKVDGRTFRAGLVGLEK